MVYNPLSLSQDSTINTFSTESTESTNSADDSYDFLNPYEDDSRELDLLSKSSYIGNRRAVKGIKRDNNNKNNLQENNSKTIHSQQKKRISLKSARQSIMKSPVILLQKSQTFIKKKRHNRWKNRGMKVKTKNGHKVEIDDDVNHCEEQSSPLIKKNQGICSKECSTYPIQNIFQSLTHCSK